MNSTFKVGSASAKMVCDSYYSGSRISSIEVTFPRPFLAEFNTHCRFSRNSASSRAIPVWKRMIAVLENPYIPNSFGINKAGMQAGEELSVSDKGKVVQNWLAGRDVAVAQAYFLVGGRKEILSTIKDPGNALTAENMCDSVEELIRKYGLGNVMTSQDKGLHKQHANRVLETYAFHTVIVTATHWRNFFGLRASTKAQPEACDFALAMAHSMKKSLPCFLERGDWHLPYITDEDRLDVSDQFILAKASAGKCARTSYLTHDGIRSIEEDVKLFQSLKNDGHMSPFQHPARPKKSSDPDGSNGNYSPVWTQLRKTIENESDFSLLIKREDLKLGCRGDEDLVEFILSLPY